MTTQLTRVVMKKVTDQLKEDGVPHEKAEAMGRSILVGLGLAVLGGAVVGWCGNFMLKLAAIEGHLPSGPLLWTLVLGIVLGLFIFAAGANLASGQALDKLADSPVVGIPFKVIRALRAKPNGNGAK